DQARASGRHGVDRVAHDLRPLRLPDCRSIGETGQEIHGRSLIDRVLDAYRIEKVDVDGFATCGFPPASRNEPNRRAGRHQFAERTLATEPPAPRMMCLPEIALVIFDAVLFQKLQVLLLKRPASMMLFLFLNVFPNRWNG